MKQMVVILIGLINLAFWGQHEIQLSNKALQQVLQKAGLTNLSAIEPLSLSDSLNQQYKLQGTFYEIKADQGLYRYLYVGRVNSCRVGGCSISAEMSANDDSEYFDYCILYDKTKTVQLVRVLNYQATHGHEITVKGWLKQFIGHNAAKPLQVHKNIDAISGATMSVNAITADIATKTKILQSL